MGRISNVEIVKVSYDTAAGPCRNCMYCIMMHWGGQGTGVKGVHGAGTACIVSLWGIRQRDEWGSL